MYVIGIRKFHLLFSSTPVSFLLPLQKPPQLEYTWGHAGQVFLFIYSIRVNQVERSSPNFC